jgi:photosynthetic reaction center cytochrome c subunit
MASKQRQVSDDLALFADPKEEGSMKLESKRMIHHLMATMMVYLLGIAAAHGQTGPTATAQKEPMAEDVFKNVQVLRGIPLTQFMQTMGFFAASLSLNCTDCHVSESGGSWARYADDTPLKQTARRMVVMMNAINKADFGGARMVTCYTCHRGIQRPEITPSLTEQYSEPPPEDPDKVDVIPGQAPKGASADQILDKYIQALGGAQQLAKITSVVAKGTYMGFDTDFSPVPIDIFAKAPNLRAAIVHTLAGDNTTVYDGQDAWVAAVDKPVPLYELINEDLDGAAVESLPWFPAQIRQRLSKWRTGFPEVTIADRPAVVIEGTTASGTRVKLYFDKQTGLLVRQSHYTNTVIGLVPTHIEYSDYRVVAGVKMPFKWTATWVDGQSTTVLTQAQANVAVDAAKFAKPNPAVQKVAAASSR